MREAITDERECHNRAAAAADALNDATLALAEVDLNILRPDEVRDVLDAREALQNVCLRLRDEQHRVADHLEERDETDDDACPRCGGPTEPGAGLYVEIEGAYADGEGNARPTTAVSVCADCADDLAADLQGGAPA